MALTAELGTHLQNGLKRLTYSGSQMARIAWYTGHYAIGRRRMGPLTNPGEAPYADWSLPLDRKRLRESFSELFRKDWHHIKNGVYKLPPEVGKIPNVGALMKRSRDYFRDAEKVAHRKAYDINAEVLRDDNRDKYPRYFLQNFHYQTDGWLSAESAERYETQVETLFTGAAGAMRRTALPFIHHALNGSAGGDTQLVDLGCGTGTFLREVINNWPHLNITGLDLSPAYLAKARNNLGGHGTVNLVEANAEATGLPSQSADIVSAIYLFHELPPKVRAHVMEEAARLLKPGGIFILTDTIQYGDEPGLDILLENFPRGFHEPYYDSFCKLDIATLAGEYGLSPAGVDIGFLTKSSVFSKS